jgi:hypothetical protein
VKEIKVQTNADRVEPETFADIRGGFRGSYCGIHELERLHFARKDGQVVRNDLASH